MNGPLLVIVGETASGKSSLAMELAKKFSGELVCADSWTVYKGFDIGTAKPSKADRAEVPHHLLDIADPAVGFSAAEFKRQAIRAIEDITARGKLPILVGGTGLYIDSVIYDYGFLPAGPSGDRERLNKLTIEQLLDEIKAQKIDLTGIDIRNKRRLIRLLESAGERPKKEKLRANTLILGLEISKDLLKTRIDQRVQTMLAAGLEKEVKTLSKEYGWSVEPMKGIGYREWKDYFEGTQDLEATNEKITRSSLHLAKKQRTWFKRNKSIHWLINSQQAFPLVQNFLSK